MHIKELINKILAPNYCFQDIDALSIFKYQYQNNSIYKQYVDAINCNVEAVSSLDKIPFLPIQFFKTHRVICEPASHELIFKSSGTTATTTASHFVKNKSIYEQNFLNAFTHFLGNPKDYLILGLLPNYIEQGNSSLVYMVQNLISRSKYKQSNMYLYNYAELVDILQQAQLNRTPTILFGVTYALLDFAAKHAMPLNYTTIIETGGMKGRGAELTREQLHSVLQNAFQLQNICSEYGMTELLSQAYSLSKEIFTPSKTMKVFARELQDPINTMYAGKGAINVIDLANLYSASFIATQDQGEVFNNGTFTISGRMDNSDMRGCNMLL